MINIHCHMKNYIKTNIFNKKYIVMIKKQKKSE